MSSPPSIALKFIFGWMIVWSTAAYGLYAENTDQSGGKLSFSHILCRHGDRNPIKPYPNDEWSDEEFWPGGYGQLSNLGKQQHFALGIYLRKRYDELIGIDGYSAKKVYIQSSDIDRVLMSAQTCMAGMFTPTVIQTWNPNIKWQPIPIHSTHETEDALLAMKKPCDRFNYLMINQYINTTAYTDLFEQNRDLIRYLEENSGGKLPTINSIRDLQSVLSEEQSKGYCLPDWAEKVMAPDSDFQKLAEKWNEIYTITPEMKKLRSGFLLKEILDRSRSKTEKTLSPDRCLHFYFAHEFTLSGMLGTLGLFWPHTPPYASCLFFELYQGDSEPFLKVFYRNSTDTTVPAMEIPNCGKKCLLRKMYELYDDVLPKQSYDDECKLRDGEFLPSGGNPEDFPG